MPESNTTYNGWTNYATWGAPLVLDNDQGTYEMGLTLVRETRGEERRTVRIADRLRDLTELLIYGDDELIPEADMSDMARQTIAAGLAEWTGTRSHVTTSKKTTLRASGELAHGRDRPSRHARRSIRADPRQPRR